MKEKSLFSNFIYNALYNSMGIIFPLITIPYVSRILLSDGLGKVNYASNIVAWFLLFASLGIPRYGIREIARVKSDKSLLNKVFSELFYINLFSSLICSVAYVSLIWITPYFKDKSVLYLVAGIQLFLNVFNIDWFYRGIEEYDYITKRSLIVKVLSLMAMFLFVRTHEDYIKYALIQSAALVGNYILNFLNLKKYIKFTKKDITIKPHLSPIFVLLSTQLAVSIYSLLDTTMLGIWCSDSVIGYYANAHKMINILATLTASLGGVMLSRLVAMHADGNTDGVKKLSEKALDIILVMCMPIVFGAVFVSKDVVLIAFGNDFTPCVSTLMIFAPFVLFTTVGNLFGTQLLMVFGQEKKLLLSVVAGSVINFSLNYFLIKVWYQDGAAIASVITECIVMITQIVMANKYIKVELNKKSCLQITLMTAAMTIGVLGVQHFITQTFIRLIISVGIGAALYFGVGMALKNDALCSLVVILKRKVKRSK